MNDAPEVIVTEDVSHSLYLPALRETYHSTHGAMQESSHVFIHHGLQAMSEEKKGALRVFEVGFGTGLNVLLTAIWAAENKRNVSLMTIEAFPVGEELWSDLNYARQSGHEHAEEWWENIHRASWNQETIIHSRLLLTKIHGRLEEFDMPENEFDVVYYDAFAPGKQASMWTREMLGKVAGGLRPGGCLVTYCAQGQFKRDLATLGLEVSPLAGPPGKKEMTRAQKHA